MKLSFAMPHMLELKATMQPWELAVTGADQLRLARLADELGYDMIAVPEHFLIPRDHVSLSGSFYFHCFTAMGAFAGATSRIAVNSCVNILPLQHPAVTAKAMATLDFISGGRAMITVGVGWLEGEFDLLGVPFNKRGAMCEEYLAAIIELWTSEDPQFEGEFVSFRDVAVDPRPVQQPHPPIWMGGEAKPVLRRAARFAQGWWPYLTKPEDIPAQIDYIKSQPEYDGRPFDVMYGLGTGRVGKDHQVLDDPRAQPGMTGPELVDRLGELARLGVTMSSIPIPPVRDCAAYEDYCRWVMEEVAPAIRDA